MSDLRSVLEDIAAQAEARAQPPALAGLQRRRSRRSAVRGAGAVLTGAAIAVLAIWLPSQDASRPDVVVAAGPPTATASATPSVESVPPGKVAVPSYAQGFGVIEFAAGEPPLADLLSSYPTGDGVLVTAGQRRGEDVCTSVFVVAAPAAQHGPASCNSVLTGGAKEPGRLALAGSSTGPSGGGPATSLVLAGSAPAGTRTVVLTAPGDVIERLPVVSTGSQYADRVWFAVPWVEANTVVQALDGQGRVLDSQEFLLGMSTGG